MVHKILLVEDDPCFGSVLKSYLELSDYDVTLCVNGNEGLETFRKDRYDICLLDVMMPKLDGLSALIRHPGAAESAGYRPLRQERGYGQDPGPLHGGGRLCDKALQSPGTGGPCKEPAAAVHHPGRQGGRPGGGRDAAQRLHRHGRRG